jgi:diketogulonate reductase-like aldo/keto reductase
MEKLRSVRGVMVPAFMYGTAWKEERTEELVRQAIGAGFRAIDTANQRRHYVEAGVGEAVAAMLSEAGLSRADLFLQTKFTYARGQDHRLPYDPHADYTTQVTQSFASSLEHLGTDVIDSYVLHGPASGRGILDADVEVWRAMEGLHAARKARLLGVSNVSLEQLEALVRISKVEIAFVQNRCYARTGWDRSVRAFCAEHDIVYQGFSLLTANDRELSTQAVRRIAERHGRNVPQVVFRFAMQIGMLPLTGTTALAHMREDLESFAFELSEDELLTLERISG